MGLCACDGILVEGYKDGRFTRSAKVAGLDDDSSGEYGHGASNVEIELAEVGTSQRDSISKGLYIPVSFVYCLVRRFPSKPLWVRPLLHTEEAPHR